MPRQALEIVRVDRCDQAASGEIGHGDDEGIHRMSRTLAGGTEQLPRSHPYSCVHRIHLHAFALEPREHLCIGAPSSNDLREDSGDGSYRQVTSSHLRDQGSNAVAPLRWPARYRGESFAIEKQH